jgi:putative oxidoreductase
MLQKLFATDNDPSTILLRLALGIVFFPHGAQKLLGWFGGGGFSATIDFFGQMGMPAVITVLVIVAEFFGSLGLIFGLLTRIAALGIGMVMAGAMFLVHWQHGFFMNWTGQQQGEGFEYHLLALGLALALLIRGGGRWSVDSVIAGRLQSASRG